MYVNYNLLLYDICYKNTFPFKQRNLHKIKKPLSFFFIKKTNASNFNT